MGLASRERLAGSSLTLFVFGVNADNAYDTLAVYYLALITHLFYRRSHFHYTILRTLTRLLVAVSYSSPIKIVW
jgi:hypothetical protein